MAALPWKTNDYFVSPWNYQDEVTHDFTPLSRPAVATPLPRRLRR
jgi:hypothetical protein